MFAHSERQNDILIISKFDLWRKLVSVTNDSIKLSVLFFISFITFYNIAISQNNYTSTPLHYYNFKDTNDYEGKMELSIPKVEIINNQLIDSLIEHIQEVETSEFRNIDDNGIYIQIIVSFLPEDSADILIGFLPLENYYMDYYINCAIEYKNVFQPQGYRMYMLGCAMFKDYLVCIETNENVNAQELSVFFKMTNEYVTLHIYEKKYKKMNNFLPRKHFTVPLANPTNYVSPIVPR